MELRTDTSISVVDSQVDCCAQENVVLMSKSGDLFLNARVNL